MLFACYLHLLAASDPAAVVHDMAWDGQFYATAPKLLDTCIEMCMTDATCQGFSWKHVNASGKDVTVTSNCTGQAGQPCCYFQDLAAVSTGERQTPHFDAWEKPSPPVTVTLDDPTAPTTDFPHFWETGINSPHSAMTLRADWQGHMRMLKDAIGYNYTRIHAPFSRDYSVAQGPNATSYFNAFRTYDFLISIGVKPWVELGYTVQLPSYTTQ